MAYAQPMHRPPPDQRYYQPPSNRRPQPPQQQPRPQPQPHYDQRYNQSYDQGYDQGYDQSYQQDWQQQPSYDGYNQQDGYHDYGYHNGGEQYDHGHYSNGQGYDQGYDQGHGEWDGQYDQGYDTYGYEQPQRPRPPPSSQNSQRRPGPRPPAGQNGMSGPNPRGPPGPPRGPPARGQYDQRAPPQNPRQQAGSRPPPAQYPDGASPMEQRSWDNPFPTFPPKKAAGQPPAAGRRSEDVQGAGEGGYRPTSEPTHTRAYSQDQYGQNGGFDRQSDQGYGDPRQRRPPPPQERDGPRNRPPMPQFQSVRNAPRDQRPTTASGTRSPPGRPPMPQYAQTLPNTPVGASFAGAVDGQSDPNAWRQPSPGPPAPAFTLPERPGTASGGYQAAEYEEMPAFGETGHTSDSITIGQGPQRTLTPQQFQTVDEERFEMPGDTPGFPSANSQNQNARPPPEMGLTRVQTSGPYGPPAQQQRPPPIRRQMTEGAGQYADDRRGPASRQGPPDGYDMRGPPVAQPPLDRPMPPYGGPPGGRPHTSGGSRPGTANGERPANYSRGGPGPGMRPPPSQQNGSRPRDPRSDPRNDLRNDPRNDPRRPPPNIQPMQPTQPNQPNQPGRSQQPQQPQHVKRSSDALPHHPVPVRPGQMTNGQVDDGPKPVPVRQYSSRTDSSRSSQPKRPQEPPVTLAELDSLRRNCAQRPSDFALQFSLAKKLVEASKILADDGGRADPRTKAANQERYTKEAKQIIKKLVAANYPEAMFYLADCYGEGSLGLTSDPKEAFLLYQSAAKLGHPASAYRTAVCCEIGAEEGGGTRRDFPKAVAWYKRASTLGDIAATYKMGIILLKGLLGQEKNLNEAMSYLRKAADRANEENPHALHELAVLYESPNTPQRNEAEALRLFTKASKFGYKFSQFRLGQIYEYGQLGATVDSRQSIIWYTKAAAQGEHQAELALSGWYLTGAEGILEHSDTEAYLWARKAANADPPLPKAMFAMGYFTEVGIGCPRSLEEAKRWYGRSAGQGFPKAREKLEELRRGGTGPPKRRENLSRSSQRRTEENCTVM